MNGTVPPVDTLAPAQLELWLGRHRRAVIAALVFGALFARLLVCLQVAGGPLPRIDELVPASDNHFFDLWGRRIAAGDWIQRTPWHPMPGWMHEVAREALSNDPSLPVTLGLASDLTYDREKMEERLWDHWLGGPTFFQEPAYPYLVGITYLLSGANVWHVFAWQLALGVLGVILVHRLALRMFSETAALAAGILAILAPIPLLYEVTLLRDGPVAVVTLGIALLMLWATEGGRSRWLVLGLAFGAAALLKQSFLFFPLAMGLWRLAGTRTPARDRLAAAGLVTAGMAVALLPAMLRNLVVGVPPLALNGSANAMLAIFHAAGASPYDLTVPHEYVRALVASDGRFLPGIAAAVRTHSSLWGFVALNARKLLYLWHGLDSGNNVDFYVFRQGVPVLAALPATFVTLVPLAGVGLAGREAPKAWPVLVALVASLGTIILAAALGRFRAPIAALLLPLAGAGIVRLGSWISARRWLWTGVAGTATALYLVWATSGPPGREPAMRAHVYARGGAMWQRLGEPAMAVLYLEESLRLEPKTPAIEAQLGQALLAAGDPEEALGHLERASRSMDSPRVRELQARALAAVGRREEALAAARSAQVAGPEGAEARELLERLEHDGLGAAPGARREAKP